MNLSGIQSRTEIDLNATASLDSLVDEIASGVFEGRHWNKPLAELVSHGNEATVERLARLLAFAETNWVDDLKSAILQSLGTFKAGSEAHVAAQMVLAPTADNILGVYDSCSVSPGRRSDRDKRALWESTMHKLAKQGDVAALKVFERLLDAEGDDREILRATVRMCLKDMKASFPSIEAQIRGLLEEDAPLKKDGVNTVGDGNCLFHAVAGQMTSAGYRCEDGGEAMRAQLANELKARSGDFLQDDQLLLSVSAFYTELQQLLYRPGVEQQNSAALRQWAAELSPLIQKDTSFKALDNRSQTTIYDVFVTDCSGKNNYLPVTLVPVLARVRRQPISLYESGKGWTHFGGDGLPLPQPGYGAAFIRFDALHQHFEKVGCPPRWLEDDGLPQGVGEEGLPVKPREIRVRKASLPKSSSSAGSLPTESLVDRSLDPAPEPPAEPPSLLGRVTGWFFWLGSRIARWFS